MKPGHAFVLGSGIAGLTSAELLSRNGWTITLLECAAELGGEASRCTQNWLHTGWLYATLPNPAALLACHRALSLFEPIYGHVLSPEIVNVRLGPQGVSFPFATEGWFSADYVHYLYALETAELSHAERAVWRRRLESVAFPRLRELGYDPTPLTALSPELSSLLDGWEDEPAGHERYQVVRSTDTQINTRRVMDTLLGLLGKRTEVVRRASYSLEQRGDRTSIVLEGERHTPDLVILATGKNVPRQLAELGQLDPTLQFKSMSCPVVVLKRALPFPNLIRFTPNLEHTINHIKYDIRGLGLRSTIGSYDCFSLHEHADLSPFLTRVYRSFGVGPSDIASVYFGTKTEFAGAAQRRYHHALERANDNTYWALPGKFSQFPLLAHELSRRLDLRTDLSAPERGRLQMTVAATIPEQAFTRRARPLEPQLDAG